MREATYRLTGNAEDDTCPKHATIHTEPAEGMDRCSHCCNEFKIGARGEVAHSHIALCPKCGTRHRRRVRAVTYQIRESEKAEKQEAAEADWQN